MNNQPRKASYSWTAVIVVLIIFWPIGIFMLISKLSNDRSASFGGGSGVIKISGGVLIGFAALMFLGSIIPPADVVMGIVLALIFGLPGLWLFRKGKKTEKDGLKFRKYIGFIVNNEVKEIVELSNRMNLAENVVINDVNDMISKGMLGVAKLNLNTGTIEFPKPKPRPQVQRTPAPQSSQQRTQQAQRPSFTPVNVKCDGCGAKQPMEDSHAECMYCGTVLHP